MLTGRLWNLRAKGYVVHQNWDPIDSFPWYRILITFNFSSKCCNLEIQNTILFFLQYFRLRREIYGNNSPISHGFSEILIIGMAPIQIMVIISIYMVTITTILWELLLYTWLSLPYNMGIFTMIEIVLIVMETFSKNHGHVSCNF